LDNAWLGEVRWGLIVLGASLGFGWALGLGVGLYAGVATGYIAWHWLQGYRLRRWLRRAVRFAPPQSLGMWGELFDLHYHLQVRHRRQRHRLTGLLTRLRQATRAMPDATVVLNADREILWFNQSAAELLGLRVPADRGQRIDHLLRHPRFNRLLVEQRFRQSIEVPAPVPGDRTLSLVLIPYGDDDREMLLIARDVSQRVRVEQVRRDFVANVSHELRTPLTVLSGFLETIERSEGGCAERWARPLQLMHQQTDRMRTMVEDLLMLAKLETSESTENRDIVSVPRLLPNIREDAVALSAGEAHQVTLSMDDTVWLRGRREELRAAFSNLVFNAIQYTPRGGVIHIDWYADDDGAHFAVSDTGVGIEPEHINRLTERFYRVDVARSRERGGTGLGLAIVKHVLDRHQGRLNVTSERGKGSRFACDFPPARIARPSDSDADADDEADDVDTGSADGADPTY